MNKVLEKFDGQVMRLTPRIARFLSIKKGDGCFKELVNEAGEYVQCIAGVDAGRMVIIERDGFDDRQTITSREYDQWRVVEQTLRDEIMGKLGIERSFADE